MIERLYRKWGINDKTDFSRMLPTDYPILSDLYDTIEDAYQNYEDEEALKLYPPEMLRDLLLGLHSMCKGADARFFNGHTNISSARFLVFCVKGLDSVAQNLQDTLCLVCSHICLISSSAPEIRWQLLMSCTVAHQSGSCHLHPKLPETSKKERVVPISRQSKHWKTLTSRASES